MTRCSPGIADVVKRIEAKIAQLIEYRDNGCQLDHARTIAEGRLMQARMDLIWLKDAIPDVAAAPTTTMDQLCVVEADLSRLRDAAIEACDLLAERTYGSPARSPGHNARVRLERVLSTIPGAAQAPPDRECLDDMTLAHNARLAAIEECARVADDQVNAFLSPRYATNQPFGSICERFACKKVAKAIRNLAVSSTNRGTT